MKENRGNEGTCVGVSRWPVHDFNHRTTSDMWLYRAYSGNLYHNGEQTLTLSSFTQGDFITCVLDMEARTISFGKNGEVWDDLPGRIYTIIDCFKLNLCFLFLNARCWTGAKVGLWGCRRHRAVSVCDVLQQQPRREGQTKRNTTSSPSKQQQNQQNMNLWFVTSLGCLIILEIHVSFCCHLWY